jgi:hypothetical protein
VQGNYLGKAEVAAGAIGVALVCAAGEVNTLITFGVAVVKEGRLVDGVFPGRAARAPISK